MKTSKQIAKEINIAHSDLMKFYWNLENKIVTNRRFIKCTLVIDKNENWLKDICESLEFAFYQNFNKLNSFNNIT